MYIFPSATLGLQTTQQTSTGLQVAKKCEKESTAERRDVFWCAGQNSLMHSLLYKEALKQGLQASVHHNLLKPICTTILHHARITRQHAQDETFYDSSHQQPLMIWEGALHPIHTTKFASCSNSDCNSCTYILVALLQHREQNFGGNSIFRSGPFLKQQR